MIVSSRGVIPLSAIGIATVLFAVSTFMCIVRQPDLIELLDAH